MGLSEEQGKSKILISSLCGPRRALRLFFLTAEVAEFVEKFLLFFKSKNTKTAKSAKFYAKGAKLELKMRPQSSFAVYSSIKG